MTSERRWQTLMRVVACGLIAGAAWTFLGLLAVTLLGGDFFAAIQRADPPSPTSRGLFPLLSNFVAAVWAIWLYAALEQRAQSARTRVIVVTVAWWVLQTNQSLKWVAVLGLPVGSAVPLALATLPAMLLSVALGAWLFQLDAQRHGSGSPDATI